VQVVVLSYFETNLNCPKCFDEVVAALTSTSARRGPPDAVDGSLR
jgi:hypothetical protein